MTRPPFEKYPELNSERIRLRELVASDLPANIDITFYQRVQATNLQEALAAEEKVKEKYLIGDLIHWGIEDIAKKEIVGCCGFYRGFANETGEIGYFMKEKHRNSGLMSEAVKLMVAFGFETMKLKKIFAITQQNNLASQMVLRKNGFIAAALEENGDLRFHRIA